MTDLSLVARVEGRAWVFPERNINSDLIMPNAAFRLRTEAEQVPLLFKHHRPGWVDLVRDNDIVVAGANFGTGSGRPWARLFRQIGIRAVVAESINDLAYRNCVNAALLAFEIPDVSSIVTEGQRLRLDARAGTVTVVETGTVLQGSSMPDLLLDIVAAGGLVEQLTAAGFLG
jgi:3-isopropylmalate/(R)-2-methylmalate dehydratase small subunit